MCIVVSGSLLLINSSYHTHHFWYVWLNLCIKLPKRGNTISSPLGFSMKDVEGGALFTFFMIYANVWFIYRGTRQGCANEHFSKAIENASKTETEISKKPSYPFFPHSFATFCVNPSHRSSKIFRAEGPVRNWQRINQENSHR